jgi:hypothetical protein
MTTVARGVCDGGSELQAGRLPHRSSARWRRSAAIMVFAGLGVALSSFASPTGAGSDLGGWVPVWSDEFDYSGPPDPSKWTVLDAPNTPAANAFVDGSALILRVDKNGKGVNMGTGNTSSIRYQGDYGAKYLFTPGRLDIRASAVLLPGIMNIAWGSTDWERWEGDTWISGEIDIFEIMGNEPDRAYMTSHFHRWFDAFSGKRERISRRAIAKAGTLGEFHIYSLEWDDRQLRLYLDGSLQLLREFAEDPEPAIFTKPRPLILNVYHMPDGYWGFSEQPLDSESLPAYMRVDYVRYYQCPTGDCRRRYPRRRRARSCLSIGGQPRATRCQIPIALRTSGAVSNSFGASRIPTGSQLTSRDRA